MNSKSEQTSVKKIQAGALPLVMVILIIISVSIIILYMMKEYQGKFSNQWLKNDKKEILLNSGTIILLSNHLNHDEEIQTQILAWGIFELGQVFVNIDSNNASRMFLMGPILDSSDRFALYLPDEHRPLSFSGKSRIIGDAHLPVAGVRKSFIEMHAYEFDQILISGNQRASKNKLPQLDSVILDQIRINMDKDKRRFDMQEHLSIPDSLNSSFKSLPTVLYSSGKITLDQVYLKAAIIIISDYCINITANAILEDIILIAPSIHFDDGYSGTVQAFASDSITVGRFVTLQYPSVLGILGNSEQSKISTSSSLSIDSGSMVQGIIFSHNLGLQNHSPKIQIKHGAKVYGQVYSIGSLELRGEVLGTTYTQKFTLQTQTGKYENFILDGIMDVTGLSPNYIGSSLIQSNKKKGVIKWVK